MSMDRHDLVRIVDPSNIDAETIADSNTARDAFQEFIHGYEDPTDKSQDESALHRPGRNTLLPTRALDGTDDLEAMYMVSRTNLFDSLSVDSLSLRDSVRTHSINSRPLVNVDALSVSPSCLPRCRAACLVCASTAPSTRL